MKVGVVRNRKNKGIINRFGQPCPEVYGRRSVQRVMDGLRAGGHTVKVFEGDMNLLPRLKEFMPPDAGDGTPTGLVFNMAYGIQGEGRYVHLPAVLEMAGVPYTGAGPVGHALSLDKIVTKTLIRDIGVPTPRFRTMSSPDDDPGDLRFPLVVKPRHESTSYGLSFVRDGRELADAVGLVVSDYQQEALVEEYIEGREFCVAVLGNEDAGVLPLVELDFGDRDDRLLVWDDKYHKRSDEPQKLCPAPVDERLAEVLRELSVATFRACRCRDYARVDIRVDRDGNPFVLEINSMASLGPGGSYVLAATTAGHDFPGLVNRIVDVAHERYFGTPAPRGARAGSSTDRGWLRRAVARWA